MGRDSHRSPLPAQDPPPVREPWESPLERKARRHREKAGRRCESGAGAVPRRAEDALIGPNAVMMGFWDPCFCLLDVLEDLEAYMLWILRYLPFSFRCRWNFQLQFRSGTSILVHGLKLKPFSLASGCDRTPLLRRMGAQVQAHKSAQKKFIDSYDPHKDFAVTVDRCHGDRAKP